MARGSGLALWSLAALAFADGTAQQPHFWPGVFGAPSRYGLVPWPGPGQLPARPSWRWESPHGKYGDVFLAAVLDGQKNAYVTSDQRVRKLSPDGQVLWTYKQPGRGNDGPAILGDSLFVSADSGRVVALDLDSGRPRWEQKVSYTGMGDDQGFVTGHGDTVVVAVGCVPGNAAGRTELSALNASTGRVLWRFKPDSPLFSPAVQYTDDGTLVFQDMTGRVYRLWLSNGTVIWKNGGISGWGDGGQFLGPNGIVYATSAELCPGVDCSGWLSAYSLSDGSLLWQQRTPHRPDSAAVVGQLKEGEALSVVLPVAQRNLQSTLPPALRIFNRVTYSGLTFEVFFKPLHLLSILLGRFSWLLWWNPPLASDVLAFDAATGAPRWHWRGPVWRRPLAAGDEEGFQGRLDANVRKACAPRPWSAPRIGSDGTIYIGNRDGRLYALRDANGDGRIDGAEVSSVALGAAAAAGSAHAPGLAVIASCDGVIAWRW